MDFTYAARFEARADQLEAGIADIQRAMREMARNIDRNTRQSSEAFDRMSSGIGISISGIVAGVGALATAAGVAGAAGALRDLMNEANGVNDMLDKAATRTGITAERMSTLAFAAAGVDAELTDLQDGLLELQKKTVMDPAKFEAFGVSIKDTNGEIKDADALLESVADAMQKSGSAARQAAMADELLGGAGRKLIPILQGGADGLRELEDAARGAGAQVSQLEAKSAGALAAAMQRAQSRVQSLGTAIAGQLNPLLVVISDSFGVVATNVAQWVRANEALIQSELQAWLSWVADTGIPAMAAGAAAATRAWMFMATAFTQLQQLGSALFARLGEAISGFLQMAARAADAVGADGLAGSLREGAAVHADVAEGFAEDVRKYEAELAEAWDAQDELEAKIGDLGVTGSLAVREVARRVAELRLELAKTGQTAGQTAAAVVASADEQRKAALAAMQRETELAELGAAVRAGKMEIEMANLERLAQLEEVALDATRTRAEETAAYFQEVFGQLGQGVTDITTGMIQGTMSTTDALKEMGKVFLRITAQQLAAVAQAAIQEQAIGATTAASRVSQNAAVAASGAAASQAGIPIVGPILAGAAIPAMLALVMGLIDTFNSGGIVGGRVGGSGGNRDSVLIGATTGEAVIDRETTARLAAILGAPSLSAAPVRAAPASSSPSSGGGQGGGGSVVIQSLMLPESRLEAERAGRMILRATRQV